ncbi:hypothetical protein VIBNIAM115_110002 [Vibrio nigripulchritudo AM115]|nr:hypothetical protein VIBNIAM115_110002 [Vibrio nigripulchritudo AM115]
MLPLADWMDKSRILSMMLVVSSNELSAVSTMDIPSFAFRIATSIPRVCTWSLLAICRPAASSFAVLILEPEDKRSSDVLASLITPLSWCLVAIADTLVLTVNATEMLLKNLKVPSHSTAR